MGIFGLERYLMFHRNESKFCYDVDLEKLAAQYEKETNKKPVIVVDGTNFIHFFYNTRKYQKGRRRKDCLLGGQLQHFVQITKDFVEKFEAIGISLEFYFADSRKDPEKQFRKPTNEWKLGRIKRIFSGIEMKDASFNYTFLPLLMSTTGKFVPKYECDCKVILSKQSKTAGLAGYARINKCFGILSSDTEFVIMPGDFYIFTLSNFDLNSMIAVMYDKFELAKKLSLDIEDLALFGAILSSEHKSDSIHKRIISHLTKNQSPGQTDTVTLAADVVRTICQRYKHLNSTDHMIQELTELWRDIADSVTLRKWLQAGINEYMPQNTDMWDRISKSSMYSDERRDLLQLAYTMHINCETHPDILNIILGKPFEIGAFLENCWENNTQSSQIVFRSIRQRIYGILLHDTDVTEIEEWGSWNGEPLLSELISVKKLPAADHPGLLTLWKEDSDEVWEQRWEMIAKSVSSKLKLQQLKELNPKYLVPVLVLHFLMNEHTEMLKHWEADAFILQAVTLNSYSLKELEKLVHPVDNPRVVNLATLFSSGINNILFLMGAVGYPLKQVMPWHYFDGPLFYHVYRQREKGIDVIDLKPHERQGYEDIKTLVF